VFEKAFSASSFFLALTLALPLALRREQIMPRSQRAFLSPFDALDVRTSAKVSRSNSQDIPSDQLRYEHVTYTVYIFGLLSRVTVPAVPTVHTVPAVPAVPIFNLTPSIASRSSPASSSNNLPYFFLCRDYSSPPLLLIGTVSKALQIWAVISLPQRAIAPISLALGPVFALCFSFLALRPHLNLHCRGAQAFGATPLRRLGGPNMACWFESRHNRGQERVKMKMERHLD
jgi:hypothetical protein